MSRNGIYPPFFRHVVFPGLDLLNGTRIHSIGQFLVESEGYRRQQLRQLQEEKLERMLAWTRQHSSFYAQLWQRGPETRRASSLYSQLDGLPIVTKAELRPAVEAGEFPLEAYGGRSVKVNTSGSTGVPMVFYRSKEQESWFWATRIRMWRWAGYRPGEPYLAINLNAREAWKKKLQDLLFRCTYLTYNADNQDSQQIVEFLAARKITHINAFSSTLLALAQYMARQQIPNPGVRAITATGDNLAPPQRQMIEDVFGVRVTDYYGAGGEGVHLASQCAYGTHYHVHMENAITEVIKDGRPAKPGEVGTIVVTQLDNQSMPLIRYELGDLATVGEELSCPCGRDFPILREIHGRACDMIYTPSGGALLPQFFFIAAFKTLGKVHRYQIVQDRLDHLTIRLVAEPGCDPKRCEQDLAENIHRASDGSFELDFHWVEEIPLTAAGKPRPVVSLLEENPLSMLHRD